MSFFPNGKLTEFILFVSSGGRRLNYPKKIILKIIFKHIKCKINVKRKTKFKIVLRNFCFFFFLIFNYFKSLRRINFIILVLRHASLPLHCRCSCNLSLCRFFSNISGSTYMHLVFKCQKGKEILNIPAK